MDIKGWRYGIIKHLCSKGDYYAIHEIHRDGDKLSWTEKPISIIAEDLKDIRSEIAIISRDIEIHEVIVVDENGNRVQEKS